MRTCATIRIQDGANRRELRAVSSEMYAKAQWYAITHDFRRAIRNMRIMIGAIEDARTPFASLDNPNGRR